MANDINKAIASGGYVIVPEKAVDGAGRNAIYVYMTYNAQDGYQTWKISGGLNGGILASKNGTKAYKGLIQFSHMISSMKLIDEKIVQEKLLELTKTIFRYFSKTFDRVMNFLIIIELFQECFLSDSIEDLGSFFLGGSCWLIEYFIGILVGAILAIPSTILGNPLLGFIIGSFVSSFVVNFLTNGYFDQCQQNQLAKCRLNKS